jgi:hypothetical protein
MKKPELTKEESEVYLKIVTQGNMDDMFDFAYAICRERLAKEQLDVLCNPAELEKINNE